jgi:hypothetical protein
MSRGRTLLAGACLLAWLAAPAARATHSFVEQWDEAGVAPEGAEHINVRIDLLFAPAVWVRDPLAGFRPGPTLPVSGLGDLELLWDNGIVDAWTLHLTPNDEAGNYPSMGVTMETYLAAVGDLPGASAEAGVVVRFFQDRFYTAFGSIDPGEEGLGIRLQLWKGLVPGRALVALDSGAAISDPFPAEAGENFLIRLTVSAPDPDTLESQLAASLFRIAEDGPNLIVTHLATLTGLDSEIQDGRVGLYMRAGSVGTQIAFDESRLEVLAEPPIPAVSRWGLLLIAAAILVLAALRVPPVGYAR